MAALPADAALRPNPVPNTPEVLAEARAHWADHCASCHANDGSGDSLMGRRTYPPAPDMRRPETQHLSDGELFYIIQNGVRLTAIAARGELSPIMALRTMSSIPGSSYFLFVIFLS